MGNPTAFLNIPRKEAGYRPIHDRVNDYGEVEQTLNTEDRRLQASRCMECGVPFCHWSCPLGNRQPEWQDYLYRNDIKGAYQLLTMTDDFPEFTGRVCPALCEKGCVLNKQHEPVTIRENEAAIVERAFSEGYVIARPPKKRTKYRVAVVGSGPAGLACANQLNRRGHNVTVFEKNEAPGGLLRFGIPDFKLNKSVIDRRLDLLKEEGIEFKCGICVGTDISIDELLKDFDAVCLAMGAEVPRDLKVDGRDLKGVHFALELLQQQNRVNAGAEISREQRISAKKKNVLVIGGGDTGSDCVGTAHRQGALSVTQIEIMPKPPVGENPDTPWPYWPVVLKTSSSHLEGCDRRWLLDTRRFIPDADGRVREVEVETVEWKKDPETGRMNLVHTGKTETIKADLVLLAMGFTNPIPEGVIDALGLEKDPRGNVKVNEKGQSSNPKVFAAGDVSTGASLVVRCIASGRKAAQGIHDFLVNDKKNG
ncbi:MULTISPECIES: glutamate synthase subunit beta [Duncaniella]|jgi:glutamate synthase (NADPH/NADH) small chain|uniref:glutamate synthase subunit beta n=1 Tax=Duncaniella TaxID=2518495 RepID=UPI000AA65FCD|nr:glutamate synthase subunit beta [Duncaniella sp.]MBJ2189791.1 glutamate synthase subunit beta [Muribaculaceae bacterium]ROS86411.1 glutamate synthase subunit beta [Muribaculaceae bacterium Isolate-080 (Janvier)]HBN64370.1 glutamate synthase [Porphyromonadaceae bacterium]